MKPPLHGRLKVAQDTPGRQIVRRAAPHVKCALTCCLAALLIDAAVAQPPPAAAAASAAAGQRKVFELVVQGGKVMLPGGTLVLHQNDEVELQWRSDRAMELHLHGYDILVKVSPTAPARMVFRARLPGRFPVSEHRHDGQHHGAVVYLEVHP